MPNIKSKQIYMDKMPIDRQQ